MPTEHTRAGTPDDTPGAPVAVVLPDPLLRWLTGTALRGAGIERVRPLAGGYRSGAVLVTTDDGSRYVLRRHRDPAACAVEAALVRRLRGRIPVPDLIAADPSGTAAGAPAMLSRYVPGDTLATVLPALDAAGAAELGAVVGRQLAAIGSVTFARRGFFTGPDLDPRPEAIPAAGSLAEFVAHALDSAPARAALDASERAGLRRLAAELAPLLSTTAHERSLVHADFNPKNLVVRWRAGAGWVVAAVLDWEFAFSGPPLVDVGNMLRFPADLPGGFGTAFVDGFRRAGGRLPDGWERISRALDLYALVDLVTRPPGDQVVRRATALVRQRIRDGI